MKDRKFLLFDCSHQRLLFSRHKDAGCTTTGVSHFTLAYTEGLTYVCTDGRTVEHHYDFCTVMYLKQYISLVQKKF